MGKVVQEHTLTVDFQAIYECTLIWRQEWNVLFISASRQATFLH